MCMTCTLKLKISQPDIKEKGQILFAIFRVEKRSKDYGNNLNLSSNISDGSLFSK